MDFLNKYIAVLKFRKTIIYLSRLKFLQQKMVPDSLLYSTYYISLDYTEEPLMERDIFYNSHLFGSSTFLLELVYKYGPMSQSKVRPFLRVNAL
jgi:hypothetical protein